MDVALFRFSLIAPLLNNQVEDSKAYLESDFFPSGHDVPHYGPREYPAKTIRSWLSSYRQGGLIGLLPANRKDKGISRTISPALGEKLFWIAPGAS